MARKRQAAKGATGKRRRAKRKVSARPDEGRAELPPERPPWLDAKYRRLVLEVNSLLLAELATLGTQGITSRESPLPPDVLMSLRELNDEARERLARVPILLIDAGFLDTARWSPTHRARLMRPAAGGPSEASLPESALKPLARAAFVLVWEFARAYPKATGGILGMPRSCAELVADLSLHELDALIEYHWDWIGPRWADRPERWRKLLKRVANVTDASLLEQQALQLIFGDLFQS